MVVGSGTSFPNIVKTLTGKLDVDIFDGNFKNYQILNLGSNQKEVTSKVVDRWPVIFMFSNQI